MFYAIISEDHEQSLALRKKSRPAHIERLEQLRESGRLLIAGPHPKIDTEDPGEAGFSGSLIVAEFDSLNEAQKWADSDPYLASGVYKSVCVKPFKKVLP